MMLRTWQLDDYLFGDLSKDYTEEEREIISARLKHEMDEIFYGRKLPKSPVYSSTE
jgi:S-adenosylmethionine decarboxylase